MPEKMTIAAAQGTGRPERPRGAGAAGPSPAATWREWLCGARREREQRVEDLGQLAERRVGERAGRVEDAGDAAEQVAEQVARALDGVDAQLDLVGADDQAEQVEVDRAEVE